MKAVEISERIRRAEQALELLEALLKKEPSGRARTAWVSKVRGRLCDIEREVRLAQWQARRPGSVLPSLQAARLLELQRRHDEINNEPW